MVRRSWMIAVAAATLAAGAARSQAQEARQSKERAALVVDGQVQGVYRAARPDRTESVVQIRVAAAGTPGAPIDGRPRPSNGTRPPVREGDVVYAHVLQEGGDGGRSAVPPEGSWIRAYLDPRDGGGWRGASPDWFELRAAPNGPQERPGGPGPEPPSGKTILKALGVKADPVEANGRLVLKVVEVLPGTPMHKAGFEKGDVVIGVNGSGFASLQRLADLLAEGPPQAEFTVLNVRDQEQAAAQVDVSGLFRRDDAPRRPEPSPPEADPTPPRRSLGADLEPARQGRRAGLKVTAVHPNSPAQKAGFEVGDVLVEAAGSPLPDEASLHRAVDRAGATLAVVVLDNRTGREVPVEVPLGESKPGPEPSPAPTPAPDPSPTPSPGPGGGPSSRAIGLTVKPGTADLLPVVKVASVAPGSPAAKAGVEAGDAIVGVNDRVVFAPDLFEEALKDAGRSFTLTVLDVKTGKKTAVKVDLGR